MKTEAIALLNQFLKPNLNSNFEIVFGDCWTFYLLKTNTK